MSPSKELPVKEADLVQQMGRSERERRQGAPSEMISTALLDGTPPGSEVGEAKKKSELSLFLQEENTLDRSSN